MVTAIVVSKMTTLVVKARKRRGMGRKHISGVNTPTHGPNQRARRRLGNSEIQNPWNSRLGRLPSASVPSGNKTPRRSVCTLNVCMLDQQRSCSHEG